MEGRTSILNAVRNKEGNLATQFEVKSTALFKNSQLSLKIASR